MCPLAGDVAKGHSMQLVIDEWDHLIECALVALAPQSEEARDVAA